MTRAVVLDRDGVINDNSQLSNRSVNRAAELILFPDVPNAILRLNRADYIVCVATNQGGVALGYLSAEQLDEIHIHMKRLLTTEGARIDGIRACIHAPHANCSCRKPKPGMLLSLQSEFKFNPAESFMVGDRDTDVEAGIAAGLRTVHIGQDNTKADFQAANLSQAVDHILESGQHPGGRA